MRAAQSQPLCWAVVHSISPLKSSGKAFFHSCWRKMDTQPPLTTFASTLPPNTWNVKTTLRKQFSIKFPMHSISSQHFLWGPEFFVLLTWAVTIYCFVLGGYYDHNFTNPVNSATILMCISLGKCRDACSILKAFPFLFPPSFFFFLF